MSWEASSKVGSLDNVKHVAGGGKVKVCTQHVCVMLVILNNIVVYMYICYGYSLYHVVIVFISNGHSCLESVVIIQLFHDCLGIVKTTVPMCHKQLDALLPKAERH